MKLLQIPQTVCAVDESLPEKPELRTNKLELMNSASELLRALAYNMLDGLLGDAELLNRLKT